MKTFHYPKYQLRKSIKQTLPAICLPLLLVVVASSSKVVFLFFGYVFLLFVFEALIDSCRHRWGWVAKIDEDYIYLLSKRESIPKNEIKEIKRQIIAGNKVGIDFVFNTGKVLSKRFLLDDKDLDQLVEFLDEKNGIHANVDGG